jgi:hypothetical protein
MNQVGGIIGLPVLTPFIFLGPFLIEYIFNWALYFFLFVFHWVILIS